MIYTLQSSWLEVAERGWEIGLITNSFTDRAECATLQAALALGDITFKEALDVMPEIVSKWMTLWFLDEMEPVVRLRLIDKVTERPPHAAAVYHHRTDLTPAEDKKLWDSFSPRMPAMRKGFLSGKFIRVKDKQND